MAKDSVTFLNISVLQPNPFQPRNKIKDADIQELKSSIKRYGILEPLVVAQTPAGYQIIAGERRWRAAQAAGLTEVPVLIKVTTPKGMLEMALIENVQRTDLNPIERGQAFLQLQHEFNMSTGDVAERVDKSLSYISNTIKLLSLPDAIKDGMIGGQISEGHARAIAGIEDQKAMVLIYKQILKENASVRRAEELARIYKAHQDGVAQPSASNAQTRSQSQSVTQADDTQFKKWEDKIKKLVAANAKLNLIRSRNSTRIIIVLKGSPEDTQDDLEKIMGMGN
jgi:ParB family transcriptional regulator, chromosome partitioning protein